MWYTPYYVKINDTVIDIYARNNDGEEYDQEKDDKNCTNCKKKYSKLIKSYNKWESIFVGIDNALLMYGPAFQYKLDGNSLLIKKSKNTYISVEIIFMNLQLRMKY